MTTNEANTLGLQGMKHASDGSPFLRPSRTTKEDRSNIILITDRDI